MNRPILFLDRDNKAKLTSATFSCILTSATFSCTLRFLWKKNKLTVNDNALSLYSRKIEKLSKNQAGKI